MCLHSVSIVIELAGAGGWTDRQELAPTSLPIRLVESGARRTRTFTLFHGSQSVYTLTADETDELLRLLGQMVVKAPWEAIMGFDGCTYTLMLRGPMSGVTFNWWVEVPQGWETIGAVADYVMDLAGRVGVSQQG